MERGFYLTTRLQYHILRHFMDPGEEYVAELAKSLEYSPDEIRMQLSLSGSKFQAGFARNPLELWEIIKAEAQQSNFILRTVFHRGIYTFNFNREKYTGGIGTLGISKISDLTESEKLTLEVEIRGGFPVKTVSIEKLRLTWELQLVVLLSDDPFITTIFPGIYAPPFPDRSVQDEEESHTCEEFWRDHALVR